ncbi:MAG: hypothetical protein HUU20_04635 [Pirellulales bacterium]|nr:hypothetical protein [Pirellulales bacterium]
MNPRRSFVRKIVYLVAIAALLVPLFLLSQPATTSVPGAQGGPGGKLAQLREANQLSESQLGDIDPTSETIKLATLGMRGVATVFLWDKANDYKKKKDWTNLSATLNQMVKLEPHFITVWRHQAWNLSYNVSAEFDDYRERYRWVIRGIEFLKNGIRYNSREPKLVWDTGWFIAQKIGRADEHKQFRRLFKADEDFNAGRPIDERDNWLVGKEWFAKAEVMADQGMPLRGTSPVIFYSDRAMCQMNYSDALEKDGIFEEKAKRAWQRAGAEWHEFGDREITTSTGERIQLNDLELHYAQIGKLRAELDGIEPGLREKLVEQKRRLLGSAERAALEKPADKREGEEFRLAFEAEQKISVNDNEVARRISGENRKKALELAKRIEEIDKTASMVDRYRNVVNFEYWRRRARIEQDPAALAAREYIYNGDEAFARADLITARESYDKGLTKWRELLDKEEFKGLVDDVHTGEELVEMVKVYRQILEKRDEKFPEDFILADVLRKHERPEIIEEQQQ